MKDRNPVSPLKVNLGVEKIQSLILLVIPERADWKLEFPFPRRAGHFEIFYHSSLRLSLAKLAFYHILVQGHRNISGLVLKIEEMRMLLVFSV